MNHRSHPLARPFALPFALGLALAPLALAAGPAAALSTKECSTKYQAAKAAGTLGGTKWNDFRKAQCGEGAAAAPAAATATVPNPMAPASKPAPEKAATASPMKPATPAAATSQAAFPRAVDPKYAKESAGRAREHTCLDQYNANKAAGGNGGLNWIQKGGGYYSECNKRLKS